MLSSATGARGFIGRYIHGPVMRGEQRLLDFARPDNIILTNIDINEEALVRLQRCVAERNHDNEVGYRQSSSERS